MKIPVKEATVLVHIYGRPTRRDRLKFYGAHTVKISNLSKALVLHLTEVAQECVVVQLEIDCSLIEGRADG